MAPDARGGELYSGQVVFGALVVACGYAPELPDTVKEPLDMVALAVHPPGEREAALAIGLGRDIGLGVSLRHGRSQVIGIVTTVCQQDVTVAHIRCQCFRLCAARNLSACQAEFDRSAFGIDECVDLAREAAAGTEVVLDFRPVRRAFKLVSCASSGPRP